MFKFL